MPREGSERSLAERARSDAAAAMDRRGWLAGRVRSRPIAGPWTRPRGCGMDRRERRPSWLRSASPGSRSREQLRYPPSFASPSMRRRSCLRADILDLCAATGDFTGWPAGRVSRAGRDRACSPLGASTGRPGGSPAAGTDGAAFPFWSADSRSARILHRWRVEDDRRARRCRTPGLRRTGGRGRHLESRGHDPVRTRTGQLVSIASPAAGGVSTAVTTPRHRADRRLIAGRRFSPTAGASSSTKETAFRSDRSIRQTCKR